MPLGLVQSIENFLDNREYQEILEDLLEELLDKKYAAVCLKRIRLIGKMIVEIGKIDKETLETAKL